LDLIEDRDTVKKTFFVGTALRVLQVNAAAAAPPVKAAKLSLQSFLSSGHWQTRIARADVRTFRAGARVPTVRLNSRAPEQTRHRAIFGS
jgi:hypothetical protein